ncbi:uncharacterized protein LOC128286517 [Gossypium arboreum]|uniref:uncharacterized protein LOC128286517 n=1 Tax=Gossypium arboreum TaxID=29729 RepID=UPI0022F17D8E|nr:uncharacterized protein LOC128286517 [Gossypium arboreum]
MTNSRRMKKKRHKTLAADLLSKGYCHDESLDISTQSCNGVNGTLTARRHGRRPAANIGARYDHNNAAIAVNFFYSNFVASTISTTIDFGREYFPSTNINASLRFPEYGSSKVRGSHDRDHYRVTEYFGPFRHNFDTAKLFWFSISVSAQPQIPAIL